MTLWISRQERRLEELAKKGRLDMVDGRNDGFLRSDMDLPHATIDDDILEYMVRDTANAFHCERNSAVARVILARLRALDDYPARRR